MCIIGTMHTNGIGHRLRRARLQRGWTQHVLASKIGKSRIAVTHYESGRVVPSVMILVALARALGLPVERLIRRTTEKQ